MVAGAKVALVTGAASRAGIGFATARRLAGRGDAVVLTDIAGDAVQARAAELRADGAQAVGLAHDVTSQAAWREVLAQTLQTFGRVDILVNNAGIAVLGDIATVDLDQWRRQIDVNLTSVFLGCQAAIGQMRLQGEGGAIVNVSSIAGLVGMRGASAYAASKGGVRMMTKALALDVAPDKIRINSVHPGMTMTDIQAVAFRDNPAEARAVEAALPLGRAGQPDEVAAMIAFLASEDAAYATGAEFTVDGGFTSQ